MSAQRRGVDGVVLHARVSEPLGRLSRLARELGVVDLVAEYLTPLLGRWSALHDEADRWRAAAATAREVTGRLTAPLGGLDAAWHGADADSFVVYMRRVGLSGDDLSEAMEAVAGVLDGTADALRRIATELAEVLATMADDVSAAMDSPACGERVVREYWDEHGDPVRSLYDCARDVLESFARFCRNVASEGGSRHAMPSWGWVPSRGDVPRGRPAGLPGTAGTGATTATAAASAPAGDVGVVPSSDQVRRQLAGGVTPGQDVAPAAPEPPAAPAEPQPQGGGVGMMPMMGGMGGAGGKGGDREHTSKLRLSTDPKDIFGEPEKTAPPVIGELPTKPAD